MTTEADYTPEEWELLVTAPGSASLVVIAADKSGIFGMVKEILAVDKRLEEMRDQGGSSNELIASVAAWMDREDAGRDARERADDARASASEEERADPERAKAEALERVRAVAALLAAKSTPDEAAGFKRWLLEIADTAAKASKEGGFLGIGGTRVSAEETEALDELRTALGVGR